MDGLLGFWLGGIEELIFFFVFFFLSSEYRDLY